MQHICKIFYCDDLNDEKYNLLFRKAETLRNFKNECSEEINKNLEYFMSLSFFDWSNHFRRPLEHCNNQDVSEAIKLIYTNYNLKLDKYLDKISFKIQDKISKHGEVSLKHTATSKIISYLCKYWNDGLISFLEANLDPNDKKYKLRRDALTLYNKYPERIINLVKSRHDRMFLEIKKYPIILKSLNFKCCNELITPILRRNKNTNSKYRAIITIGGQKTKDGKIHIPVKYSEDYHGTIESYDKPCCKNKTKKIYYQVELLENKLVKIVLTKEVDDYLNPTEKENYYGIDVNIKHNLFCDSLGNTIDFDRDLLNDYITFSKKLDNKHAIKDKNNLSTKRSKKDNKKFKSWTTRIKDMLERKSRELVNQAISLGKDHIVLEDLSEFSKGFSRSEEFQNIKCSRLVRLLSITGLKTTIKRIANKHGIQVTFVQSHYTSQTCKCGHISKNNRKTQEIFKCESCGRELNADVNAASNIEDRLALDVLRSSLLSKDKDGNFQPKKLRKEVIKSILYDFYSTQQQVEIVNPNYLDCSQMDHRTGCLSD